MPKHIGGSGQVKIELVGVYSVTFPLSKAIATPPDDPEEFRERITANGDIIHYSKGVRPKTKVRFFNIDDTDYLLFKNLGQLIDVARADQQTLRLYPHYNSAASGSIYYDCIPPKEWKWRDFFENYEGGQELEALEFISKSIRANVTQHVDFIEARVRVTSQGDTRVTSQGGRRVI